MSKGKPIVPTALAGGGITDGRKTRTYIIMMLSSHVRKNNLKPASSIVISFHLPYFTFYTLR